MGFYFNLSLSVSSLFASKAVIVTCFVQVLKFQMLYAVNYTVVCTLGPRLILNLREAYYAPYTEEFDEHWRHRVNVMVVTDDFSCE